jgi:molybdenum cofactor synthesis domain-containing protein
MLPSGPMEPARTAAVLIIGNEILSGKIEEKNLAELARLLRELGVRLDRVVVVPDDVDVIAAEVAAMAKSHDWLFTSGGVGPTHDDVTIDAVAKAFGVPVVSAPEMEAMIRAHYGDRCTEHHLRMALVPKGASLEVTDEVRWHTVRFRNVWCLPGVPEVFRMKLAVVKASIGAAPRFVSLAVYTKMDEGDLRPLLDRVVADFPGVEVGSYPKWHDPLYKTKVTFDGRDEARVRAAHEAFVAILPEGEPQPIE